MALSWEKFTLSADTNAISTPENIAESSRDMIAIISQDIFS